MKRISALMGHWYVRIKGCLALYGFVNSSSPMRFEFRLRNCGNPDRCHSFIKENKGFDGANWKKK